MRDFARYVILSPVMSGMAGPAMARTISQDQRGNPLCESGVSDPQNALGLSGRQPPSKGELLGSLVLRAHADA